jgi:hypothetical protein
MACVNIVADAFIGTDGTGLPAHSPDVIPSGFSWHNFGSSEFMELGAGRAVSVDPTGGFASIYNAAETPIPGLTLPYRVTFAAYCDDLDSGNGTYLHLDGPGVDSTLSQIKIDLFPTSLYVFVGNNLPTTFDYGEASYAVASGVAHTVELYVESGQFTVTIDGGEQAPVALSGGTAPIDATYVAVMTNAAASYVDSLAICLDAAAPAPPATTSALPLITVPAGLPVFLADGHSIDEDSVYAQVGYITGHSRARRVHTGPEREVAVSWILEADEMAAIDDWYENTLQAGALQFAVQVENQGAGLLWWTARWIDFQTEMMHLGRGRVSGRLFLIGEGSVAGPEFGALSMEIGCALLDVRSVVTLPTGLAMEIGCALTQPVQMRIEISVPLLSFLGAFGRITEDGARRITEDDVRRITEI